MKQKEKLSGKEEEEEEEEISRMQSRECDATSRTNDDVQRAIEGLKEIPDEELQEFLDDEDFMEGLDVVDAWEGDEEKNREQDSSTNPMKQEEKPETSRERHHAETKRLSNSRDRPKKEEKKCDELRRDPIKSTKDIERDKLRTKRNTESKLLAEKEKAIKHLLDSDNVVPPGTETEAIQNITEEQNRERAQHEAQHSKEYHHRKSADRYSGKSNLSRRKSPDRFQPSPYRRPFPLSPEHHRSLLRSSLEKHKSPFRYSPIRRKNSPRHFTHRSPIVSSPDRRRSPRLANWERCSSDRRWSAERHRRRVDMHERRRSRSRDRRSRSMERFRRRSRSRSPVNKRYSPYRRSRTLSRSPEKRSRKRSPFINELARQLRNEAMMPTGVSSGGYTSVSAIVKEIAPLLNTSVYQQEGEHRLQSQVAPAPPSAPPAASSSFHTRQVGLLPPSLSSVLPIPSPTGPLPFRSFDSMPFYESMTPHSIPPVEYSSDPIMYNQSNNIVSDQQLLPPSAIHPPLLSAPVASQSISASAMDPYKALNISIIQTSSLRQFEITANDNSTMNHTAMPATSSQLYKERDTTTTSYNSTFHASREERLKTPEPPIISKPKQFEKTSLSSLLEASVSAKDSSNIPMLYPGFKPEIMRYCEQALCQLPLEDPRLKMKGRFFYDHNEENNEKIDAVDHMSNSILLQRNKRKIFWEEYNSEQQVPIVKATTAQTRQKICQTDKLETDTKGVQACVATCDFASQVYPYDLDHVQINEEKRPITDRLDWSVRETYEHVTKYRDMEDLRWSLNNSSRRTWNKQGSPVRASEHESYVNLVNYNSQNLCESSSHSRENFSSHKMRDHYSHIRYSPDYHRRSMERNEFHEQRSNHSRGESPMDLDEESDDELTELTLQRGSDWHGRGKPMKGKSYNPRGKHTNGKSYRSGRSGYRGKF